MTKLAMLVFASLAVTAACADDSATTTNDLNAADFRCRSAQPDGSCVSTPASCPVTVHHSGQPSCPVGATLIPLDEDDCAHKLICID